MMIEPIWWKYAIFGDDGYLIGIAENAPEDAKKAYQEDMEKEKKGIKL